MILVAAQWRITLPARVILFPHPKEFEQLVYCRQTNKAVHRCYGNGNAPQYRFHDIHVQQSYQPPVQTSDNEQYGNCQIEWFLIHT